MDDITATIQAADGIIDDSLVHNISQFKEKIEASGLFNLDNLRLDLSNNDKYGTVIVPMKRQNMIYDIMDLIRESMNVNILYSINSEKGSKWKTVAYSMPYHGEMYIIGLESVMYGVVEEMTVTFFNSIDVMFAWLRDNLEAMQNQKAVFLHKQDMRQLYRIFM